MDKFDAIIIGGGPGGAKTARILAIGGKSVALVESAQWGGVCLNCGCIPTKMLLGATAPKALLRGLERQRVAKGGIDVEYEALQKRIQRYTRASSQTLAKGLEDAGVSLFNGRGICSGPHSVRLLGPDGSETGRLTADTIILACGTRSAAFPGLVPDHDAILDSTDLLAIPTVPESLIIVGAGAIGLEMGDFFSAMGCTVTMVEAAPQLAPTEDADIARELQKLLAKTGRVCLTGVKASSLLTREGKAVLKLDDGQELTADKALVAVGRTPNTAGLEAEKAGCSLNKRGFVSVDEHLPGRAHGLRHRRPLTAKPCWPMPPSIKGHM